jgi:hypothetical protein
MAAERVGRRAYCLELDPCYVDVTIRRWQAFTRQDAIHTQTGSAFDERAIELLGPSTTNVKQPDGTKTKT